jgi:hypothetical protein
MSTIDDEIDRIYQGPFGAFIEARNALARSARRPDLKQLEKPSLPAWAVNQVHWHQRALLESLAVAATALREQHRQTLAGAPAGVHAAEQTHREALRACLAAIRTVLAAGGHPVTPATLDAIRDTLQAVPTPEVNGRLTRSLTPRGMEALAGLVVAPRLAPHAATADDRGPDDDRAERAERDRRARRDTATAALHEAQATVARADAAVALAAQTLAERRADHAAALAALADAQRLVEECS